MNVFLEARSPKVDSDSGSGSEILSNHFFGHGDYAFGNAAVFKIELSCKGELLINIQRILQLLVCKFVF